MRSIDRNPKLIDAIRSSPQTYLSAGRTASPNDLALELATDVLYLHAPDVSITKYQGWHVVASSEDWLTRGSKWSTEELFFRIEFLPAYGNNANRAPVLLVAFAKDVVTYLNGEPLVIQGCGEGLPRLTAFVANLPASKRVVAFRGRFEQDAA